MENKPKVVYRYFFAGTYTEKLDAKSRISIPLAWQDILRDKVVITKGKDGCLTLWTLDYFQYYARQKLESCSGDEETNNTKRLFIGGSKTLDIDAKGRMWLPEDLLSSFDAEKEIYFVGVGDYVELWTEDLFVSWREEQISKQTLEKHME